MVYRVSWHGLPANGTVDVTVVGRSVAEELRCGGEDEEAWAARAGAAFLVAQILDPA
jgi:hypothetical protein